MAKIKPSESGKELSTTAISDCELRHITADDEKVYEFHKVFKAEEGNGTICSYLNYLSNKFLEGEDCNVVIYGGKDSGKANILRSMNGNVGLIESFIKQVLEIKESNQLRGTFSFTAVGVDDLDIARDLLYKEGPLIWKFKFDLERWQKTFTTAHKAQYLDTSDLTKIDISDIEEVKRLLKAVFNLHVHQKKSINFFITLNYDGEYNGMDTHGRFTFVELIDNEFFKKAGTIEKVKSAFADTVKEFREKKLVNYNRSYLTFLLRDVLCYGVRTVIICSIDPSKVKSQRTKHTLNFASKFGLDFSLSTPFKRAFSTRLQAECEMLSLFLNDLENSNYLMKDELKKKLVDQEKRVEYKYLSEEIYLKKKEWKAKEKSTLNLIKTTDTTVKELIKKFNRDSSEKNVYETKIAFYEEELKKIKLSEKGDPNYCPLKTEVENCDKELLHLEDLKEKMSTTIEIYNERVGKLREKYPNFNEATGKAPTKTKKRVVKKTAKK